MSCIIFLKGVTNEEYNNIEKVFDDRLLEDIDQQEKYNTKVLYDSIIPTFTSLNTWKKQNNIRCWTCDFTFTNIPIFIPISLKEDNNQWNISVLGNFCSFNCACRHIIDYLNKDLLNNLLKLYDIFYNKKISKIEPSPRRQIMEKYGGYMSEECYINYIKKLSILDNGNITKEYIEEHNYDEENEESE